MRGVGEHDEAALLHSFFSLNAVFAGLPAVDRDVIEDICKQMGEGEWLPSRVRLYYFYLLGCVE